MGMARPRHGFEGSITLPPSPRNEKKLLETPGCGSSSARTHTHPTSASCPHIGEGEPLQPQIAARDVKGHAGPGQGAWPGSVPTMSPPGRVGLGG